MSRRREPDLSNLPPPELKQAELGQSKAFEDRTVDGPPAAAYVMQEDGSAIRVNQPSDCAPANDTAWGGKGQPDFGP
jgi:hypothetical protein